jgi:transcriptional regulator of heat shock response
MKQLNTILLLSIIGSFLVGCASNQDKQKTVEELNLEAEEALAQAKEAVAEVERRNKSAEAALFSQSELDERHAENFLTAAKDFKQDGQVKQAISTLKEVVEMYPETKAAQEAAGILKEIQQEESGE